MARHAREAAAAALTQVRRRCPLIHHITNNVTTSECANIVKCLGASPVMTSASEEAGDMTALADALVLNIGTLTVSQLHSMMDAGRAAAEKGIPIVLDVCGAGATAFRDRACAQLIDRLPVRVIKGNASEIAAVAGRSARTRGVDAGDVGADLDEVVRTFAHTRGCVVAMTGKIDRIGDGGEVMHVANGHEWMARVVGTGCMATSIIAAFAAVESDPGDAAVWALAWFGVAAEQAARDTADIWTFRNRLFTAVATLDPDDQAAAIRIRSS